MDRDIHEKLQRIAREVTEEAIPVPRWAIGDIVEHPDGYPVQIVNGILWKEFPDGGQRLVNQWSWRRVDGSGNPFGATISGSGWAGDPAVSPPSFGH
jgi:hypothetical protein|nr:hypothetical protein [Neorhizobium tomejilense]